jgi:hypothetical protein
MKSLGNFLKYKNLKKRKSLDSDTIFYIFNKIIETKYGQVGKFNIKVGFYKNGVIFLEIGSSNWANEVWLNKQMLIDEINKKIGGDEIKDIKIKY